MSQPPHYPYPQSQWPTAVPQPPLISGNAQIAPVPGTEFGLAYTVLAPVTSGQAVGALAAGIASILVGLVTICFGLAGAAGGWGPLVSGAFAILATVLGAAAIVVGLATMRAIRVAVGALSGLGMAKAAFICGIVGASLTVLGFGGSLLASFG